MERHNCLRSIYFIIFGAFYIIFGYLVDIFGRLCIYLIDNFVYLVNISWTLAHFHHIRRLYNYALRFFIMSGSLALYEASAKLYSVNSSLQT